jgi:hypothetical protein
LQIAYIAKSSSIRGYWHLCGDFRCLIPHGGEGGRQTFTGFDRPAPMDGCAGDAMFFIVRRKDEIIRKTVNRDQGSGVGSAQFLSGTNAAS